MWCSERDSINVAPVILNIVAVLSRICIQVLSNFQDNSGKVLFSLQMQGQTGEVSLHVQALNAGADRFYLGLKSP